MAEFKPKYPSAWKAITKALRENGGSASTKIALELYGDIEAIIDSNKKCSCKNHEERDFEALAKTV